MEAERREVQVQPGARTQESQTLKFEAAPGGIKLTTEGVNAEGNATKGGARR